MLGAICLKGTVTNDTRIFDSVIDFHSMSWIESERWKKQIRDD